MNDVLGALANFPIVTRIGQQLQLRHAYTAGRELVEFQAFNLAAPRTQTPANCGTGAATATDGANAADAPDTVIRPRAG